MEVINTKLIDFIKGAEKSFRITYWDGKVELSNLSMLYKLFASSLVRDSQFNEKNELRSGDFVEILLDIDGKNKVGRYIFRGINNSQFARASFPQIKLEVPPQKNSLPDTWYVIDADNAIWRLKKISSIGRITKELRLQGHELNKLNFRRINPTLTISAIQRLIKETGIQKGDLHSFKRTKILLLLKENFKHFTEQKDADVSFCELAETFPMGFFQNNQIRDFNTARHIMTQRGEGNSIVLFSQLEDVFDFIIERPKEKFLICTNKFSQIYNETFYQGIVNFFSKEENSQRVSLLVLPKIKHLRSLYDKSIVNITENNIMIPILNTSTTYLYNNIGDSITKIDSEAINKTFVELENIIKEYDSNYRPYAERLIRVKWLTFSLISENGRAHQAITNIAEDFKDEDAITNLINNIVYQILVDNPKLNKIQEIISNKECTVFVNSLNQSDFQNEILTTDKSNYNPEDLVGRVLIIPFFDYYFFRDIIIPDLLFGKIKMEQLRFVLYLSEAKMLKNVFKSVKKKLMPLIANKKILNINAEINEALEEFDEFDENDFLEYDTEKTNVTSKYVRSSTGLVNDPPVEIKTYFFESSDKKYVAYLTDNFKPLVLGKDDKLVKCEQSKLKMGDVILFFGEQGARNILHTYPVLFYNDKYEEREFKVKYDLIDEWRKPLRKEYNLIGFDGLIEKLKDNIPEINQNKLDRWLNDDTLIAPSNPEEAIEKIARSLSDFDLLGKYRDVAEACKYFQSKAKSIGKKIRKIALRELSEITTEDFFTNLSEEGQAKIHEIAASIKLVKLYSFNTSVEKVLRSDSNKLFDLE